jgi:membrane-bound lytic murein transglycosylase MltF
VTVRTLRTVLACLVLAAACREPAPDVARGSADSATALPGTDLSALAALRRPAFGDLDSLRARRTIRVLLPMSHTYFFYDGLRERGFSVEELREFETWLNRRLRTERTPIGVVFIPASRERFLTDLAQGRGDIAAGGVAVTEHRRHAVAFTDPIRANGLQVVVTGPGAPPLARLEDLAGREVYVRASSSYAEALARLSQRFTAEGRAPIRIRPANANLEDEEILELVSAGVVPITVVNRFLARFWRTALDSLTVREDLVVADHQAIAYAIRRDSPQLRALLNEFLRTHRLGTAFGNTVWRRYLETNRWVHDPRATEERRRVEATIGLFRRHARTYDLDYLLLLAQGYQESQLRQDLRSRAGAVGVMQLLPSTAAAPPISVPGIARSADANIRAGAKYLRHLQDTYFADTTLSDLDRHLFALAAYNAGPGRVASLRRMARTAGLDDHVWFQHVELIAAREIGRETTTYVRNILKYYVTYQLAFERAEGR